IVGAPAVLVSSIAGWRSSATLAVSGCELIRLLPGGVPWAVALLVTMPASTSAWVIVCTPVQVVTESGGEVAGMSTLSQVAAASRFGSVIAISARVTLPVFSTTKVYGMVSPASVIVVSAPWSTVG